MEEEVGKEASVVQLQRHLPAPFVRVLAIAAQEVICVVDSFVHLLNILVE